MHFKIMVFEPKIVLFVPDNFTFDFFSFLILIQSVQYP